MMKDWIDYKVEDGIATLTLNRPEKRNAMNVDMLIDFGNLTMEATKDDSARVLIITGAGGAFCAGSDLSDFAEGKRDSSELPKEGRWWSLVACPKPVIGVIDGPAVGMGAEFSSMCDVRIATPESRFAWNFAQRGLVPDTAAGTWLLPRIIGPARAFHLLYSGDFLSAQEAHEIGYINEVVEQDMIQERGRELAHRYMQSSPFSHRRTKDLIYEGFTSDINDHRKRSAAYLKECFASEDHKEGVMAFFERREANFKGR